MNLKTRLLSVFPRIGIGITSQKNLQNLKDLAANQLAVQDKFELVASIANERFSHVEIKEIVSALSKSTSQLGQDLLVLLYSDFKLNGFFVEFGATNGKDLSNTYILEKQYGWKGILAEPAKSWHSSLKTNRNCSIETNCVWSESNQALLFNEVQSKELSTLDSFADSDMHADSRKSGKRYFVNTISLEELLIRHGAPQIVDYLSVDTEGSEYEILRGFNFNKYKFNFISCEHNFTESRELVHGLLVENGYRRILEEVSKFDDWYIHSSLVKA